MSEFVDFAGIFAEVFLGNLIRNRVYIEIRRAGRVYEGTSLEHVIRLFGHGLIFFEVVVNYDVSVTIAFTTAGVGNLLTKQQPM